MEPEQRSREHDGSDGGNRSQRQVVLVAVVLGIWAMVTPFMWRDLHRRSSEQVRGPKWLWWLLSANLSGSAAYWLFGRRQTTDVG